MLGSVGSTPSTPPFDRRPRAVLAAAVAVALLGLTVACVPPEAPDPFSLNVDLGAGELVLHWSAPGPAPAGYDVQVFEGVDGPWLALPSVLTTSTSFTGVVDGVRYLFRIRVAGSESTDAGDWGPPVSAVYVEPVLPILRIETASRAPIIGTDTYVDGQLDIDPNGAPVQAYSGTMEIKGRGNTTAALPKRPFKLKLTTKSPLLGMESEKDWVLLANYRDKSQLRNHTAFELGAATELDWTPNSGFVEVVLNGRYEGVYQLTEQVEVSSKRVDIDEMESEDVAGEALTGGYLLEVDQRLEEHQEIGFRTAGGAPVVIKDPEPPGVAQYNYIRNYVQGFESALYSSNYTDPVIGYRSYLDVDSLIDWYLVQEVTRNQDAFFSSTFLYKPRGAVMEFGPLWDFDLSMGTTQGIYDGPSDGWHVRRNNILWLPRIFSDPAFVQRLVERWDVLRSSFEHIAAQLPAQGAALEAAIDNDAAAWGYELDPTDEAEFLADWLTARIAWMDEQYHPSPG